jgi:hypothetical protein
MVDNEKSDVATGVQKENPEIIHRVATKIIEPALQKALEMAKHEASPEEIVSALANCYGGLLVDLLGREGAASFLKGHALHIASLEKAALNS